MDRLPVQNRLYCRNPPVRKIASRHPRSPRHKFHVFAQLPKELRILIWETAMPDPRVIHLRYRGGSTLESRTPPPALLFACRESFEIMTKFYTKTFGTVLLSASTWFNFRHDTLYIDTQLRKQLPYLYLDTIRVENLAIYAERLHGLYRWGDHYMPIETLLHKVLRLFSSLQKLTIITFQYFDNKHSGTIFKEPLLLLPVTEQQQLDEARKYSGPCTEVNCYDIARDDRDSLGVFRPLDVGKLKALGATPEANSRPELNETHFDTVRAILNGKKAPPLKFKKLERLRASLTASDRRAWMMPKEIKLRIATDSKGSRQLDQRAAHMVKWGIVSDVDHAYAKTESWPLNEA